MSIGDEATIETVLPLRISTERPSSISGLCFREDRSMFKPKASVAGTDCMALHKLLVIESMKHHRERQSMKIKKGVKILSYLAQSDG